jgi:hypothetical protein
MSDPQGSILAVKVRRQPAGVHRGAHPNARHRTQHKDELPAPSFASIAWPVAVGLVLAFFAPQLRDMLGPYDPWGMRIVFPFVLLAGRPELGISEEMARNLPQLILFAQVPLEGLLTMYNLSKRLSLGKAITQLCFLHFLGLFVLWLLAQQGAPSAPAQ